MTFPSRGSTLAAHTGDVASLAGLLPSMPADIAALHRTVFDRRFEPWLREVFAEASLRIEQRDGTADDSRRGLAVELRCDAGSTHGFVDTTQWGPLASIESWLQTPGGDQVAALIFETLLHKVLPRPGALPGLEVASVTQVETEPSPWPLAVLHVNERQIRLGAIDPGLALHVAAAMRSDGAAALAALGALRLPGRLRLSSRPYALAALRTLGAGDLVIVGRTATQPAWWLAGCGTCLAAPAELDWDALSLRLAAAPQLRDDDAQPSTENPTMTATLADLQVPVAFEIDTARLTLDELSGMASGCVIAMDVPLAHAPVRIVCQGQHVGVGQLVAIGEHLGVRIERMHWNGHAGL
ncbi:MAG TPA: type III secretion system cytoplasmic ring protein SctQ [Methylibium sp.]|uniref:type III secretion system cytoplasmic ring protein SctQ n=1 Tax=Methylibium sp. TaxID=2067992 RepID=UPI002DBF958A|nr:type III secretion system cytoplasmic ring protein SctQ [Methylibium sp.]HEU4459593.1 type III secretion system cytoplasmic ring protein SctQ [Methylibium sp.]